jgi:hypothetical protein
MRRYIFTKKEREMLENAFQGVKLEGLKILRKRIRDYEKDLDEEYKLLKKASEFFKKEKREKRND